MYWQRTESENPHTAETPSPDEVPQEGKRTSFLRDSMDYMGLTEWPWVSPDMRRVTVAEYSE